jgi:type II restriction enzyme
MKRNFEEWLSKFCSSISDYKYYIDFNKVYENVNNLKIELNILNSLIGSKNIEQDFKNILKKYPNVLKCIPILLAVRSCEIEVLDNGNLYKYKFDTMNYNI